MQREVEMEDAVVDVEQQEQEEGKQQDPWDVLQHLMRAATAAVADIRRCNRFEMSEEEADARAETWMAIKELVEVQELHVLTETTGLHLRATQAFTDVYGIERKVGVGASLLVDHGLGQGHVTQRGCAPRFQLVLPPPL